MKGKDVGGKKPLTHTINYVKKKLTQNGTQT